MTFVLLVQLSLEQPFALFFFFFLFFFFCLFVFFNNLFITYIYIYIYLFKKGMRRPLPMTCLLLLEASEIFCLFSSFFSLFWPSVFWADEISLG